MNRQTHEHLECNELTTEKTHSISTYVQKTQIIPQVYVYGCDAWAGRRIMNSAENLWQEESKQTFTPAKRETHQSTAHRRIEMDNTLLLITYATNTNDGEIKKDGGWEGHAGVGRRILTCAWHPGQRIHYSQFAAKLEDSWKQIPPRWVSHRKEADSAERRSV